MALDPELPTRPRHIPSHAGSCLEALARSALGDKISLGGAFGLLHYHDYRTTHDIDAWWEPTATEDNQRRVVDTVRQVLEEVGTVRVRAWGDVVSIELIDGAKKVFSFQIARRSVRLQAAVPSPWPGVLLDSFDDLVASKMVALVERGAPRDFRDIYTLCQTGLVTPAECWHLWRERETRAGADADPERARYAVETHVARISSYRPLSTISDLEERRSAQEAREWYEQELLNALVD